MAGTLPSKKLVSLMIATSAREAVAVGLEPRVEVVGARLLLPLEDEPEIHRQLAPGLEERLGGAEMHVDLALVVGRAPGQHPAVVEDRLERRRVPQVERIDRLDVVVAVDDRGRRAIRVQPVAVDHRVAARLGDLDMLDPHPRELRRHERRRAPAIRRVLWQRRDARDPEERLVVLEAFVSALVEKLFEGSVGSGGRRHRDPRAHWGPECTAAQANLA